MIKRLLFIALVTLLAVMVLTIPAHSETPQSRMLLARAESLLKSAQELTLQASRADHDSPAAVFHYDWLITDIQALRSGIQDYLNQVRVTPQAITRLHNHYSGPDRGNRQ